MSRCGPILLPARALAALLIGLVHGYRLLISPLKRAPSCRFQPTCSEYALVALRRHGPFTGAWLAVRRLLRCHPLHPGGYDPVPLSRAPAKPDARRTGPHSGPDTPVRNRDRHQLAPEDSA